MRNHFDQDLRCRADGLPLLLRLIDQRFGFRIQALRLFDDRLCSIEKIEQRLGRRQGFLNLFELGIDKIEMWPTSSMSQCSNIVYPRWYQTGLLLGRGL